MVYKTEIDAATHVSNVIANNKELDIAVLIAGFPINMDSFVNLIFTIHPELIACIDNISMQAVSLGTWNEVTFHVSYTDVMPSAVAVIDQVDYLYEVMLRDVQLHRRYSIIAFPNTLEDQIRLAIEKITEIPKFLFFFIHGTMMSTRRRNRCDWMVFQVKYIYSCGYADSRLRSSQAMQAVNEIVQLSKANGNEDWKKALFVVKHCVENWSYGKVDDLPGLEFSAYGALVNHTAVCMGISLAICAIFSELGIPCRYIRGVRNEVGHAWNLVFLRGGWFYLDVTDAIVQRDPFYQWGMTELIDRTTSNQIDVTLKCNCPVPFLRRMNVTG